jgi:tetratricopeptide (TPR) repeat protein
MDPRRPEIHFRIGHLLLSEGNPNEALKEFDQEYELNRNSGAAYEIAEICRKSGQLDKARDYFELALKSQPDFEQAHIGLARVLLQVNQAAEALKHLKRALDLNAANEVAHYQLALVYRALGDAASQERELAEFNRLHHQSAERHNVILDKTDLTKQTLDPTGQ